jgi:hypothetical protein
LKSRNQFGLKLVLAMIATSTLIAPLAHSAGKGTGGIPAVLAQLDQMQRQMEANAEEIAKLRAEVADIDADVSILDANVTPCTLERFRNGLCGADNHPLDLVVSICGNVGSGAALAGKYSLALKGVIEAGVGWGEVLDVSIGGALETPAAIGTFPFIVIPPNEIAAQLESGVGVGLDGCLADLRIPIGKNLSEPVVLALLESLEAAAQPVQDALMNQMNGSGNGFAASNGAVSRIGLDTLAIGIDAAAKIKDAEILGEDPLEAFRSGPIAELAGSLPIGERLRTIVADPGMLLADFVSGSEATASANQAAGIQTSFGVNACAGSGILASKIGPICDLIDSLPEFERVVGLVEFIEQLPNLSEMIDGIGTLLDPLFVSVNETTDTALTLFCNSGVGQRRIFNGLCGR